MNYTRHGDDCFSASSTDGRDDGDDGSYNSGFIDDPYCNGCDRQFIDMVALNQHLFHSLRHHWCFECSRDFRSQTALVQVSPVYIIAPTTPYSGTFRSMRTPSPIADATSNALSAKGCSRVPLESPCTSNLDATMFPDITSLLQFRR